MNSYRHIEKNVILQEEPIGIGSNRVKFRNTRRRGVCKENDRLNWFLMVAFSHYSNLAVAFEKRKSVINFEKRLYLALRCDGGRAAFQGKLLNEMSCSVE
ncbi:hypothetical protein TNCV_4445341 [Trichonephila clavipes]|nr:hypothetical protein TNCV_4445341 [Trichonephila clavipes]